MTHIGRQYVDAQQKYLSVRRPAVFNVDQMLKPKIDIKQILEPTEVEIFSLTQTLPGLAVTQFVFPTTNNAQVGPPPSPFPITGFGGILFPPPAKLNQEHIYKSLSIQAVGLSTSITYNAFILLAGNPVFIASGTLTLPAALSEVDILINATNPIVVPNGATLNIQFTPDGFATDIIVGIYRIQRTKGLGPLGIKGEH